MRNAILTYATYKFGHSKVQGIRTGDLLNMIPQDEWQLIKGNHKFGSLWVASPNITYWAKMENPGNFSEWRDILQSVVNYQTES